MNILPIILAIVLLPLGAQALVVEGQGSGSSAVKTNSVNAQTNTQIKVDANTSDGNKTTVYSPEEVLMQTNGSVNNIVNPSNVKTDAELSVFTDTLTTKNENVAMVDSSADTSFAVTYKHKGKFLGFIPVTINSRTTVAADAEGRANVTTSFPWWRIFVTGVDKSFADVDAALESSSTIQAYTSASADASASIKAQMAEAVVATLNAKAGVTLLGQ